LTIWTDDRGASSVEYGLILTAIAAAIVAVLFLFGGSVTGIFESSCGHIGNTIKDANGSIAIPAGCSSSP
jgi:pilus assembly protein Flp/PilA